MYFEWTEHTAIWCSIIIWHVKFIINHMVNQWEKYCAFIEEDLFAGVFFWLFRVRFSLFTSHFFGLSFVSRDSSFMQYFFALFKPILMEYSIFMEHSQQKVVWFTLHGYGIFTYAFCLAKLSTHIVRSALYYSSVSCGGARAWANPKLIFISMFCGHRAHMRNSRYKSL